MQVASWSSCSKISARIPARVSAFATRVFSRLVGRKTRTDRPDFCDDGAGPSASPRRFADGAEERRAFFFIRTEDSGRYLEGTINLRARRGMGYFLPHAARPRNQSRCSRSLATGSRPRAPRRKRRDRAGSDRLRENLYLRAALSFAERPGDLHRADARARERQARGVARTRLGRRDRDGRSRLESRSEDPRRDFGNAARAFSPARG